MPDLSTLPMISYQLDVHEINSNATSRSNFSKVFCHVLDILKGHTFISSHYVACKYTPFRFIELVLYTAYQSCKNKCAQSKIM